MASPIPSTPSNSQDVLRKFYDVVASCNRCGFCTSYCPTYNATGDEGFSPRGRNQTFRAIIEGRLIDPVQAANIVGTCLLCGECTSVCFSEVPTAQLMIQARNCINQNAGLPKYLNFFLRHILSNRKRFSWFIRIGFIGKMLGLSKLLRVTGLLRRVSPILAAADVLVERVPLRFLTDYDAAKNHLDATLVKADHATLVIEHKIEKMRKRSDTIPEELMKKAGLVRRPKVAYLPVCGSKYLNPRIGLSTVKLCERLNLDFVIPDLECCGLPAASSGALDHVREIAKQNIQRLEKGSYEALVVDDASCGSHFKEYPKFFQDERDWQARAQAVAQKVRDVSSFLLQRGLSGHLRRVTWTGGPVAYHDPCKAQYSQKITQPPRELLLSIHQLKLVPIYDADQCCGGGGTYSFTHADLSQEILKRKIKNVISSGGHILVTSAASCLIQLSFGLRDVRSQIQVLHITEFLARVLEKKH